MKRNIAIMMVVLFVLSAFAGCASPAPAAPEAPAVAPAAPEAPAAAPAAPAAPEPAKPAEITVVTSYGGDDGNRGNYENAIASYQKKTGNVVLDASATSNEEWKAKVMTDFQTGTEPDVLFYFSNSDSKPIIEAGKVVSLDEIRAEYPDYAANMKDDMMSRSEVDGKVYAVPSSGFWETMFVNKKVLKAAGVSVPGADYTWEQFLADCEKIKAAGYTPIAVSLQEVPHYWFEFMVYNNGNQGNHLALPATGDDAVAQKWAAGIADIKALFDAGYLPKNTLTATDSETVQMLVDDQAAFLVDGSWKVGFFTDNCADRLGDFALSYVPGKGERKASDVIGGISMGYFITRKAWDDPVKREAAVSFVTHMTSDEVLSTFVTTEVTALKNGAKPAGLNDIQQSAAEMCGGVTSTVGAVQDMLTAEARADIFANVKNVVTGKMTAAKAIEAALALQ